MSWRTVVVTQTCKLDYQQNYLVVRGKETLKVHIQEIAVLMIESTAVSLTTYLLNELIKNKVKIIFCDEKRNPCSELVPYYGSFDTSSKVRNQIRFNKDIKTEVWTKIVREKICQQKQLLKDLEKEEYLLLEQYEKNVISGDSTNREGHAAKVYFNSLFGKSFSRKEDNSINAALNYGYSLILSAINREISANGYLTQLGLFHNNVHNPFNLGCDLMEPFRPLVDRAVVDNKFEQFGKEEKQLMLALLSQEVMIKGKKEKLLNAIKIYVKSIFDVLEEQDESLISFYEL
ncbi:type II CRISPR-associated endonuclease Cas1 [uncultured Dubosiella sp.]|uniref:type II CRISPR-associated endonuclease Cas1 n=2 Tax=uncultured Dubosiella sp. TaxID=1937011 RepID=UPI002080B079|nr:type II CRISPR-associated endonuclease Cas1 [uncultured Dubosiella sp.]GJM56897.1 CRISPR-associated endonuclease Cas1 [Erysipelotrichaceae bacterium OPF54]